MRTLAGAVTGLLFAVGLWIAIAGFRGITQRSTARRSISWDQLWWRGGLVLAAAAVGFLVPRPATAAVPVSPTVYREGGHPLRLTWTARVREGENGSFSLYRRQSGRHVHVGDGLRAGECAAHGRHEHSRA